jgi:SNF2 family DNA or RNA helicase
MKKKKDFSEIQGIFKDAMKCRITFKEVEETGDFPTKTEHYKYFIMDREYYKLYRAIENQERRKYFEDKFGNPDNYAIFYHALRRAVNSLDERGPKVDWIVDQLEKNSKKNEKSIVFSNWIDSGIRPIMEKLKNKTNIKFGLITGDVKDTKREQIKLAYNIGEVTVLFISSAGGEGLDLMETSNVYIMESNWNVSRELQVIGRAIRYKSHINLPKEKQIVNIYRLIMKKPIIKDKEDNEESVDEILYKLAHQNKQIKIDEMVNALKQISIEKLNCCIFRHGTMKNDNKIRFKFFSLLRNRSNKITYYKFCRCSIS